MCACALQPACGGQKKPFFHSHLPWLWGLKSVCQACVASTLTHWTIALALPLVKLKKNSFVCAWCMSTFIFIPLSPHTFHFSIYTYTHFNIIKLDGIPLTYIYLFVCVWGGMCMWVQVPKKAWGLRTSWSRVTCWSEPSTSMMAIKLGSSSRAGHALNNWAIFQSSMELFTFIYNQKLTVKLPFLQPISGTVTGQDSVVRQALGPRGEPPAVLPAAKWDTASNWPLLTCLGIFLSSEKLLFVAGSD